MPIADCPLSHGFTLVEVLVVVVIVGVLALALTLAVGGAGGERQLARDAERFQALLGYACERAELTGREIGVRVDASGYAFSTLGQDGWADQANDGGLRPRRWADGLVTDLRRDGHPIDPLARPDAAPQLVCFSSGELTPFTLTLALGEVPARYRVHGDADGKLALVRVGGRQ